MTHGPQFWFFLAALLLFVLAALPINVKVRFEWLGAACLVAAYLA